MAIQSWADFENLKCPVKYLNTKEYCAVDNQDNDSQESFCVGVTMKRADLTSMRNCKSTENRLRSGFLGPVFWTAYVDEPSRSRGMICEVLERGMGTSGRSERDDAPNRGFGNLFSLRVTEKSRSVRLLTTQKNNRPIDLLPLSLQHIKWAELLG